MATTCSLLYCPRCGKPVKAWFKVTHTNEDLDSIWQRFEDLPMKIYCIDCADEMTGTDIIEDALELNKREREREINKRIESIENKSTR